MKIALKTDEPAREYSVKRFEELFTLRYLPQLEFENWQVESWIRRKCASTHQKGKIPQLALWLGKLHSREIERGFIADVTIRWMGPQMGYGVFTNQPLKKWAFVGEYTGMLRRRALFFPHINDYCFMYPREWLSLKAFTIDSEQQGNSTRFINHSDSPNCESVAVFHDGVFHIIFRTIKEVSAGSELTYDYGDIYWHRRKKIIQQPIEELIDGDDLKTLQKMT